LSGDKFTVLIYWTFALTVYGSPSHQEDMMHNETPNPVVYDIAIEKLSTDITCTDDIDVVIEDTPENDIRIATVASMFNVPEVMVRQAVTTEIENQLMQDPPDKEERDYLIAKEQEAFQSTGD
jgi:hypothetical protein